MIKSKYLRSLFLGAPCVASWLCVSIAAQQPSPAASQDAPYVLRETTREVVLDVVARDKNHNPIGDLKESEFQVFDAGKGADKNPKRILSMKVVDPHSESSRSAGSEKGFSIHSEATCALSATPHYQLAITASPDAGFHTILIKSTRAQVTLSFRRHYYVGVTPKETVSKDRKGSNEAITLTDAACFHTMFPPTFAITAHPIVVNGGGSTRYEVVVRPESLSSIGLTGTNTQIHLDYGICTFDPTGDIGPYFHTSSDRQLTPAEMESAQAHGFSSELEIPGDTPFLVRIVVRDHETGNLGIVDVSRPMSLTGKDKFTPPPVGTIRAFGVVTPLPNSFCGDVYEISEGASKIPDFWNLDPIGSVYTNALNVVDQEAPPGSAGIPGITHSVKWFGIDYYGEFFITKPGEYKFDLESDDGSRLEIDNRRIIENDELHGALGKTGKVDLTAGKHTIHVPYFQGSPPGVALILTIKPPGESTRPFNLNDFAVPPSATP